MDRAETTASRAPPAGKDHRVETELNGLGEQVPRRKRKLVENGERGRLLRPPHTRTLAIGAECDSRRLSPVSIFAHEAPDQTRNHVLALEQDDGVDFRGHPEQVVGVEGGVLAADRDVRVGSRPLANPLDDVKRLSQAAVAHQRDADHFRPLVGNGVEHGRRVQIAELGVQEVNVETVAAKDGGEVTEVQRLLKLLIEAARYERRSDEYNAHHVTFAIPLAQDLPRLRKLPSDASHPHAGSPCRQRWRGARARTRPRHRRGRVGNTPAPACRNP